MGISNGRHLLVLGKETIMKESIRKNAKMCIDHKNGMALWSSNICYPGPGHINEHRKHKRRCLGLHPFRIDFLKRSVHLFRFRVIHKPCGPWQMVRGGFSKCP